MRFVTGLFFLIGSLFIYEQSLAVQPELIDTKKEEMHFSEALERLKQVEIEFSVIRDYNDDFIALIVSSLAFLCMITVLLIGYNWFQTRKDSESKKREFDSLKNEMIELIRTQSNESSSKIDSKLSKLDNDIDKRVENITKSAIHNIKQVLLIPKYIELENDIKNQIKSKIINPHDLEDLAECAVKIGACYQHGNDIVTGEHAEDYYTKLLKLIENVLNNLQNKQCDFSIGLLVAIEKSINMVPDESYVGDNSHLSIKSALRTRLKNINQ